MSFIGTWKDDIRIDQKAVQAYIGGELKPNAGAHSGRDWGKFDIAKEVIELCPTKCMRMDGAKLVIDNRNARAACTASTQCQEPFASGRKRVCRFWSAPRLRFWMALRWALSWFPSSGGRTL